MEAPLASAADIPSVDRLLYRPALAPLVARHGRAQVTSVLRAHLDDLRRAALAGTLGRAALTEEAIAPALETKLNASGQPRLRAVFNLTGTVLHTNLGRAVLPAEEIGRASCRERV